MAPDPRMNAHEPDSSCRCFPLTGGPGGWRGFERRPGGSSFVGAPPVGVKGGVFDFRFSDFHACLALKTIGGVLSRERSRSDP
jgi:hypothetical protein